MFKLINGDTVTESMISTLYKDTFMKPGYEAVHGQIFSPINWNEDDVCEYIRANKVPYNKLHDQGYPSIGCEPCTRAIKAGEDIRAGRWWWEDPEHKECGLHKK